MDTRIPPPGTVLTRSYKGEKGGVGEPTDLGLVGGVLVKVGGGYWQFRVLTRLLLDACLAPLIFSFGQKVGEAHHGFWSGLCSGCFSDCQ